jgi:hypothetical protein
MPDMKTTLHPTLSGSGPTSACAATPRSASSSPTAPPPTPSEEQWRRTLDVNLLTPAQLVAAAADALGRFEHSDDASYVTGADLRIDAGLTAISAEGTVAHEFGS